MPDLAAIPFQFMTSKKLPYKSDGDARRIFLSDPYRDLVCGRGPKLILPLRGTKIKYNLSYSYSTLQGTTKGTTENVLKLNTLRSTQTAFLTPKMYD